MVQALLKDTNNVLYLLARSQTTEEYLIDEFAWADVTRVKIIRGDITLPNLGQTSVSRRHLATHIDEVWHTAAATQFNNKYRKVIRATNVIGTEHVLRFSSSFKRLTNLYYISTAYACGLGRGKVPEGPLPKNTQFNNVYEKSKYDAECLVRNSGLPFTIIRPSILTGDSRTGEARSERSRMIYGFILAIYQSLLRLFADEKEFWKKWEKRGETTPYSLDLRLYGSELATKNLITVDDAVNVCLAIQQSQDKTGKTFNVVNEHNLSLGTMLEALQSLLKVEGIIFKPGLSFADIKGNQNPAEHFVYKATTPFHPYVSMPEPLWITDNVKGIGVERIPMVPDLFHLLIRNYMYTHLLVH